MPEKNRQNTTVFLVGDSTVCRFDDENEGYYPRYGYGTQLDRVLNEGVKVVNLALSGRSSKSFLREENYQRLLSQMQKGDFLIIGFGHNDEKPDPLRYTDPRFDLTDESTFASHLYRYYVQPSLACGAIPILCTPIVRRRSEQDHDPAEMHVTKDTTVDQHRYAGGDYPESIRQLGKWANVPVIDLTVLTKQLYDAVGFAGNAIFHAQNDRDPITIDNTHLNLFGAATVANTLVNALVQTRNPLAEYVRADREKPDVSLRTPNKIYSIPSHFALKGDLTSVQPFGSGHINKTYRVTTTRKRYILQKINHQLFPDVEKLMRNIRLISEYCREVVEKKNGDPDRECLTLIETNEKQPFYFDGSEYWRMFLYIENSVCFQKAEDPLLFYESAVAFGRFTAMMSGFDAMKLDEVLPHFHDTRMRYDQLQNAIFKDEMNRVSSVIPEIEFAKSHAHLCPLIVDLLERGILPLRVVHNDTKLNNVLFDSQSGKSLAVVDFDTIMPGSLCYDFGDAIRYGCNTAAEDEADQTSVHFSITLFESFTRGYLSALGGVVTKAEKAQFALSAILITYENGMRFLTDYLQGDTYYHTTRPKQNLDRCRTQFSMVSEMETQFEAMKEIVEKTYQKYCSL